MAHRVACHVYPRTAKEFADTARKMDAPREPADQVTFKGFTIGDVPRLGGVPSASSVFVSSSRDGRAPELTLCAAPDYAERRRRQEAIAEELRRCREQIARLGPLVAEATDAYAMADARARARWEWVQEGVPVVDLPAAALQESHPAGHQA